MFALPGPIYPTVAFGLILIRKHVLVSAFVSVSLLSAYTVLGIEWLAALRPPSWGGRDDGVA